MNEHRKRAVDSLPWLWKEKATGGFSIEIDDGTIYGGTVRAHVGAVEEAERIVATHNKRIQTSVK